MSFDEFLHRIEDPALRAVAQHWNAARGAKRLSGWKDIDPTAIARHLPIIWSWQYDRKTDSFTGRLSGEEINRAFGKSLRGASMKDFFAGWDYEKIFQRHRRVVIEPCFAHGKGAVFIHAKRYGEGERIILPLAEDAETGDGIIGATVYRLMQPIEPGAVPAEGEIVDFYPLDDLRACR